MIARSGVGMRRGERLIQFRFASPFGAALLALGAGQALAQDSVSATPGAGDALSAYGEQVVRYVVDGAPITSSWGNGLYLAPILKASRDVDPLFITQALSSLAVSPDAENAVDFPTRSYAVWTSAGAGVNPIENSPPGSSSTNSFSRAFGVALSDQSISATNIIGATIGQKRSSPERLYVTRVVGASSRALETASDHCTLSLGAIDASGQILARADRPQQPSPTPALELLGDNLVRIDLGSRDPMTINALERDGESNRATDAASTTFVRNAAATSTNTPVAIPSGVSAGPDAIGATLDFAGFFRAGAGPPITAHLGATAAAHRGNPSYSVINFFAGADGGMIGSLAVGDSGDVDTINIFGLDASGAVVAAESVSLPATISDGLGFVAESPRFRHWGSQVSFRGSNGQVAMGRTPEGELLLAATAASDAVGDFIAVATLASPGASPEWTVAGFVGKPVLSGPQGQPQGHLITSEPIDISSPAADLLGNVYFVSAWQPTIGPEGAALVKAVYSESDGYRLERLLATGRIVTGVNSTREYEIRSLSLGDSDSIASASMFSSAILQPRTTSVLNDPASPLAFGGLAVNAVIRYDNAGVGEEYDAALFVYPREFGPLLGDFTGDGAVNAFDLSVLLGAWGESGGVADLNGDGIVNAPDLSILLGSWTG